MAQTDGLAPRTAVSLLLSSGQERASERGKGLALFWPVLNPFQGGLPTFLVQGLRSAGKQDEELTGNLVPRQAVVTPAPPDQYGAHGLFQRAAGTLPWVAPNDVAARGRTGEQCTQQLEDGCGRRRLSTRPDASATRAGQERTPPARFFWP